MIRKFITSHELARQLLQGPDLPVFARGYAREVVENVFVKQSKFVMYERDGGPQLGSYNCYGLASEGVPEFALEKSDEFDGIMLIPNVFNSGLGIKTPHKI